MSEGRSAPDVLFVAGLGRSGSTLLGRMLGSLPGGVDVGELGHLWHGGPLQDRGCSCGEPFSTCGFWQAVGDKAFGGWDPEEARAVLALQRSVDRLRFVPLMLLPWLSPSYTRRSRRYVQMLVRFYEAVAAVGGGAVPVDTSKNISTAVLLARSDQVRTHLIHLVRDPRGVAYSWTKVRGRRPATAATDPVPLMDTYRPATIGVRYLVYNLALQAIGPSATSHRLVVYEDVVTDPVGMLSAIVAPIGGTVPADLVAPDGIDLAQTHSLGGNPMRFRTGRTPLRIDEEWRDRLPRRDRAVVTALTWPLLLAHGLLRRARARDT